MKNAMMIFIMFFAAIVPFASANIVLDSIHFDPPVIASGDEVDIVIQYHDEAIPFTETRIGEKEYSFKVVLEADDDLTKEYVMITDSTGDDLSGRVFAGGYYNKVFRVKVDQQAPAGSYEFKLSGRWYLGDEPLDFYRFVRFKMPVKKEGIILDISTIDTIPAEVRPGDDFVKITSMIENVGQKDSKSIVINLELPEGLESSYSNNNRAWIGRLNAGESKEVNFFVDIDEDKLPGVSDMTFKFEYMDLDDNKYYKASTLPFLVKSRPYLEVVSVQGEGLAGDTSKLKVTVKNTGTESAESVDVRIIKQNAQPFDIDVRSDYIGELEPGEEGLAVFDIGIRRDAEQKEHDFKLLIRSKGDTDEGDDNIYTYNRRARFEVNGVAPNNLVKFGIVGGILVVLLVIINAWRNKK